jgi:hypothetical protein
MVNVTPIRGKAPPKAPRLLLTELPDETTHRVACILRYLAAHVRDTDIAWTEDEEFGQFILFRDLADALDYAEEAKRGSTEVAHE